MPPGVQKSDAVAINLAAAFFCAHRLIILEPEITRQTRIPCKSNTLPGCAQTQGTRPPSTVRNKFKNGKNKVDAKRPVRNNGF